MKNTALLLATLLLLTSHSFANVEHKERLLERTGLFRVTSPKNIKIVR